MTTDSLLVGWTNSVRGKGAHVNFYQDRNDHGHNRMYELAYPAPIHAEQGLNGENNNLPMVIALQGYADAGHAVAEAGTHLLHALEHELSLIHI